MRRDFTEEYKQKLIQMIREYEEEQICGFTDMVGDFFLRCADWLGVLDLCRYFEGADAYTKKIMDMNNITVQQIEQIFRDVRSTDEEYAKRIQSGVITGVDDYENLLKQMTTIISPENNAFHIENVNRLIGLAADFRKKVDKIEKNSNFSRDVYDLIYDENGKRIALADLTREDKDKIIQAYEDTHPKWKEELDTLLASGNPNTLTEEDIRNIKLIAYTAEEPYRTIYLANVRKYSIGSVGDPKNKGAFYRPSSDAIYFVNNLDGFSKDPRGEYTTFFHESGHATDYNQLSGREAYTEYLKVYSDVMKQEVSLQEALEYDVFQDIRNQISQYTSDQETIERILNAFHYGHSREELSVQEKAVYDAVINYYRKDLIGEVNEAASDVYGGVTNLAISGGYGHYPETGETIEDYTYWYDKNGNATGAQSRELWAEYFSYCMTGDEEALESLRRHFPAASKVLDEIADRMREKVEL